MEFSIPLFNNIRWPYRQVSSYRKKEIFIFIVTGGSIRASVIVFSFSSLYSQGPALHLGHGRYFSLVGWIFNIQKHFKRSILLGQRVGQFNNFTKSVRQYFLLKQRYLVWETHVYKLCFSFVFALFSNYQIHVNIALY